MLEIYLTIKVMAVIVFAVIAFIGVMVILVTHFKEKVDEKMQNKAKSAVKRMVENIKQQGALSWVSLIVSILALISAFCR